MSPRRAFTLVELLVVIAIIAVLAGMLLMVTQSLRDKAKLLDTTQRLEQVQKAVTEVGGGFGRTAAEVLHREVLRNLLNSRFVVKTGVLDFRFARTAGTVEPVRITRDASGAVTAMTLVAPADRDGNWFDPSDAVRPPWCLPCPWGKAALVGGSATGAPIAFRLDQMQPKGTVELLLRAGVIASAADWTGDRGRQKEWNDAWGNPLVLGFALYQPLQATFALAKEAYGYDRAVYISAAAAGPVLRTPLNADPLLRAGELWDQATAVCEASAWTQEALGSPPWKGTRNRKSGAEWCFITAPLEVQ